LDYAFGSAIALAFCVGEPRTTRGIDVNVFVAPTEAQAVLDALPSTVDRNKNDLERLLRDGQQRLNWQGTPLDIFLNVHDFHREQATRIRRVPFADGTIPVLAPEALAVFKAMFDRPKDWIDISEMLRFPGTDWVAVTTALVNLVGEEDPRSERLRSLLLERDLHDG
jgi:hypothetical protein